MAPSVVPGDPGEYQLVAARWGIGHPPGYGLYALLGNLFTRLVPIGTFAWRANLFAAVCGATLVALTYGIGRILSGRPAVARRVPSALLDHFPAIFGALALATGIALWQHAIHANAHVLTALLATFTLFCLLRWWSGTRGSERAPPTAGYAGSDRWLFAAAFIAGLSPVQHPLLVFAFPAYIAFVLAVFLSRKALNHRRLLRIFLGVLGFGILGLMAYLYYPIRSAIGPPPTPGPADMHTWEGFLRVVTAQGLRGNLGGFTLREILQRLWDVRVFLRLQFALPGLVLAAVGWVGLWSRRPKSVWLPPVLLLTAYLACVVFVTINVLQDAMAYLLGPMAVVGVLIGIAAEMVLGRLSVLPSCTLYRRTAVRPYVLLVVGCALLLILPIWSLVVNWTRMDLSDFRDADIWLDAVEARFVGRGERATLLAEWERMTTIHYYAAVEGRTWDERDLWLVPISAGTEAPFLEAADESLPRGPVYLTTYRPEVVQKYRLRPVSLQGGKDLWQVLAGWPQELSNEAQPAHIHAPNTEDPANGLEIVGWHLSADQTEPGEVLFLDLHMRLPGSESTEAYYLPWARLGETTYHFTTDSRFNTPWWQPGEVVIERFELPVSWKAPRGRVPLQVGVRLVSEGRDLELDTELEWPIPTLATLTEVEIEPAEWLPADRKLDGALGNLRGEILLRGARVNGRPVGPGQAQVPLRPGAHFRVVLDWESLRPIENNYKVFVQLLDAGFQVRAQGDDKAPLGGSAPTLLWFPRWRHGTRIADTYVLQVPADLPPGTYPLVVGMYGFTTFKRVQVVSPDGAMEGDWITLAHMHVE
jgi:hypothetical protein